MVSNILHCDVSWDGDWLYLFAPPRNKHISTLILLEPNRNFHGVLRMRAEKLGLAGRYEIIDGGIKDLERIGIQTGTIDTITTVHVLCSVEAPQALVKELYAYLKPGGQWLVYEHIKIRNEKTLAAHCQGEKKSRHPLRLYERCSTNKFIKI